MIDAMPDINRTDPALDALRDIVRRAQNDVKQLEWSASQNVAHAATRTWGTLEAIRQYLGPYLNADLHAED